MGVIRWFVLILALSGCESDGRPDMTGWQSLTIQERLNRAEAAKPHASLASDYHGNHGIFAP